MKEDSEVGKFGSGSSSMNENGTKYGNDKEKPLEFTQLKKMYDDAVKEFIDLLERIDPAVTSKLQNTSKVLHKISTPEEKDKRRNMELPVTTDKEELTESQSVLFDDESDLDLDSEDSYSSVRRGHTPSTTRFSPILAPALISAAATTLLPSVAGVVGQVLTDYAGRPYPSTNQQPGQGVPTGYSHSQSPHLTPTTNAGYPQVHFQPQPGQYQTYSPPGQQYHPTQPGHAGPTGPYQQQNPAVQVILAGYPPSQPQTPPGQAVPTGYHQGPQPVFPNYPQNAYQQQYPPPGQQYPLTTSGPSQSASAPTSGGPAVSAPVAPSPLPTKSPPKQQNQTGNFSTLQHEVIKALKDIDDQVNIILNKLGSN